MERIHSSGMSCLGNQQTLEQDRMNNLQLKEDLLTKDASLFQAQSTIAGLRKEFEQTREEVRRNLTEEKHLIILYLDVNITRNCA